MVPHHREGTNGGAATAEIEDNINQARTAFVTAGIFEWIKALHIIAVISWMAGMLYLPRLCCAAACKSILADPPRAAFCAQNGTKRALPNPRSCRLGAVLFKVFWRASRHSKFLVSGDTRRDA